MKEGFLIYIIIIPFSFRRGARGEA